MNIFPAIDLLGGKAVRLTRGEYDRVKVYSHRPASLAEEFYAAGARFLHVVDLDGAKAGALVNLDVIREITAAAPLFAEVGGGIRDAERIEKILSAGAARVILGTAAVRDPAFLRASVERFGERVALSVDARNGLVAAEGWTETTQTDSFEFCRMARDMGVRAVIYTDIDTDGAMRGTNLPAFRRLCGMGGLEITASGGICAMDELRELKAMGCAAAIVGKAIYEGALSLAEVLTL